MASTFQCSVVTPEAQMGEDEVRHVVIPAWDGRMGFLARRAPLLAKLGHGPLRLDLADGGRREWFVSGGFVQMKNNELSVLTDEAMPIDQVDREDADAALQQARELPRTTAAETRQRERRVQRARALRAAATQR